MHFRFRGNNIQVVKSQQTAHDGKAKSVPIGSINRASLKISEKLRDSCTPAELEEIEAWVRRYRAVDRVKFHHAALTLPEQIVAAARWFEQSSPEEARPVADDILSTTAMLRRVLTRRGLL
jgi:hypothetical protein